MSLAERVNEPIRSSSNNICIEGGSPGLVVMGGYSRSKGCGFKSQCRILDGHDIFHIDLFD